MRKVKKSRKNTVQQDSPSPSRVLSDHEVKEYNANTTYTGQAARQGLLLLNEARHTLIGVIVVFDVKVTRLKYKAVVKSTRKATASRR